MEKELMIILSPTKTMKLLANEQLVTKAKYHEEAKTIYDKIINGSDEEKEAWVKQEVSKVNKLYLKEEVGPALWMYNGLVFKYLDVLSLDEPALNYLNKHLRILSAMYGSLKTSDEVRHYRLEMKNTLSIDDLNIAKYWQAKLAEEFKDKLVLNLASKEYEVVLNDSVEVINVHFFERSNDKLKTKATYSKMARGELVKLMALKQLKVNDIKELNILDFKYDDKLSSTNDWYFIKEA